MQLSKSMTMPDIRLVPSLSARHRLRKRCVPGLRSRGSVGVKVVALLVGQSVVTRRERGSGVGVGDEEGVEVEVEVLVREEVLEFCCGLGWECGGDLLACCRRRDWTRIRRTRAILCCGCWTTHPLTLPNPRPTNRSPHRRNNNNEADECNRRPKDPWR